MTTISTMKANVIDLGHVLQLSLRVYHFYLLIAVYGVQNIVIMHDTEFGNHGNLASVSVCLFLRRSAYNRGSVLILAAHLSMHRLYTYHCPGNIAATVQATHELPWTWVVAADVSPTGTETRCDWLHRNINKMFFMCFSRCPRTLATIVA